MLLLETLKKLPQFVEVDSGEYEGGLLNVLNGCYVQESLDYAVVKKGEGLLGSFNDEYGTNPNGKLILNWVNQYNEIYSQRFELSVADTAKFIRTMEAQARLTYEHLQIDEETT